MEKAGPSREILDFVWAEWVQEGIWPDSNIVHHEFKKSIVYKRFREMNSAFVSEQQSGASTEYRLHFLGMLSTSNGDVLLKLLHRCLGYLQSLAKKGIAKGQTFSRSEIEGTLGLRTDESAALGRILAAASSAGILSMGGNMYPESDEWNLQIPREIGDIEEAEDLKVLLEAWLPRTLRNVRPVLLEDSITFFKNSFLPGSGIVSVEDDEQEEPENGEGPLDIFISHASEDEKLAECLVRLIVEALRVDPIKIRCTSVDGFRLPLGADTDECLKAEVYEARILVGLLTPTSIRSSYVLFELGARWGSRLFFGPLFAGSLDAGLLPAPIRGKNALSADREKQVTQFLKDIGVRLNLRPREPMYYEKRLNELVQASRLAGILHKFSRMRIRVPSRMEQYFVFERKFHYLDPGAASICDSRQLFPEDVDDLTWEMIQGNRGTSYGEAEMISVLKRLLKAGDI